MTARELLDSKKVNNHLLGMNFGSTIYLDRLMEEYAQICINKTLIAIGVNFENTLGSGTYEDIEWAKQEISAKYDLAEIGVVDYDKLKGRIDNPTEKGFYLTKASYHNAILGELKHYHAICFWDGKIWTNDSSSFVGVVKWWDLKDFE